MLRTAAVSISLFCVTLCQAASVVYWNFESPNVPPATVGSTISGLQPAIGTGTASGVHADSATSYSSPVGNGSLQSLTANAWNVGDYWQFQFSTAGFTGINLDWDWTAMPIGPTNFSLEFSTDGVNFSNPFFILDVGVQTWNSSTVNPASHMSSDLSSYTELDNAPNVYIRFVCQEPVEVYLGPNGTHSIDNLLVSGTVVPEPGCLGLFGAAVATAVLNRRRLKERLS